MMGQRPRLVVRNITTKLLIGASGQPMNSVKLRTCEMTKRYGCLTTDDDEGRAWQVRGGSLGVSFEEKASSGTSTGASLGRPRVPRDGPSVCRSTTGRRTPWDVPGPFRSGSRELPHVCGPPPPATALSKRRMGVHHSSGVVRPSQS